MDKTTIVWVPSDKVKKPGNYLVYSYGFIRVERIIFRNGSPHIKSLQSGTYPISAELMYAGPISGPETA